MEVVLATCVVFACPKLEISPPVAGGELHVVLARRMILDECHDPAAMSCKCSIAGMREELLYGGLSVLTREVLIYVGLIERPEIDGLMTFEVGNADQIALRDHETFAGSRRHVNSLSDRQGSSHAAPYILLRARMFSLIGRGRPTTVTIPYLPFVTISRGPQMLARSVVPSASVRPAKAQRYSTKIIATQRLKILRAHFVLITLPSRSEQSSSSR
jgi:hypothetical protein